MLGAATSAFADFGFSGALPLLTIKGAASGVASASSGASSFAASSFFVALAGTEFAEGLVALAVGFELSSLEAGSESSLPAFEGELTAADSIEAAADEVGWDLSPGGAADALCVAAAGAAAVPALWLLDAQPKKAAAMITTAAATPIKIFLFPPLLSGSAEPPNVKVGADPTVLVSWGAGDGAA